MISRKKAGLSRTIFNHVPIFVLFFHYTDDLTLNDRKVTLHLALEGVQDLMIGVWKQILMHRHSCFVFGIDYVYNDVDVGNWHQSPVTKKMQLLVKNRVHISQKRTGIFNLSKVKNAEGSLRNTYAAAVEKTLI